MKPLLFAFSGIVANGVRIGATGNSESTESHYSQPRAIQLPQQVAGPRRPMAANSKGELFGFERTRNISMNAAREIAEAARAWGQNDGITMVTVRRTT